MPITIDDSRAPLIIATPVGVLTDAEYAAHLDECTEKTVARGKTYAYVYDGTGIIKMTATQRKMQADWLNQHRAVVGHLNVGCGFVFPSVFLRGMLTAVHWISPPPYPYRLFADRAEAIAWCTQQLAKVGLSVPPETRQDSVA